MSRCYCPEESTAFEDRARAFISDRSVCTLTGPRRVDREHLVLMTAEIARGMGRKVSVIPGEVVREPEMLFFLHWKYIDENMAALHPEAEVLYGQDLCHQVPAVVRLTHDRRWFIPTTAVPEKMIRWK